jgi:thioredoxin reductase (NADPH)
LEIGDHPLVCAGPKATREEALKYYRGVARTEALRVRTYTRLARAERTDDALSCTLHTRLGEERIDCTRVVLATGYFDHPNRLAVPGEDLPHVSHYFDEAHRCFGLDVVVIGGKNSAVEAALELFRAGARVTLIHRGTAFSKSVKYWLRPDIENRIAAGEIRAELGSEVVRITERAVATRSPRGVLRRSHENEIPADRVYALIGFHPDFDLFRRIGIDFDDDSGRPSLNPATLETNVPGVYLAGSVVAGKAISEIFIENGRFDGEKIFGDPDARATADARYKSTRRPRGE